MPTVQAPAKTTPVTAPAPVAPGTLPVITTIELETAFIAIQLCTKLGKEEREAKKKRDAALASIFEKTLGLLQPLETLRTMTPTQVANLLAERMQKKAFQFETDFSIKNTGSKKNVAWKEEFLARLGEAAALEVTNKTDPDYTYTVVPVE